MSDRDEQNQQVEISDNVSISVAAFIGVYVSKGQQDVATTILNAIIDQVATRRAAEAQLEILRGFRRRDFKLDSFYEAAIIDQIARLQPTKGSK